MSEKKAPVIRREVKHIVEFSLPSGPITIEHELGMVRIEDQSGGTYMFPEEDLEFYVEALQLMAARIKTEIE